MTTVSNSQGCHFDQFLFTRLKEEYAITAI